jgi:hypothetical protein
MVKADGSAIRPYRADCWYAFFAGFCVATAIFLLIVFTQ